MCALSKKKRMWEELIRGRWEDVNKVWCMLDDFKARKPYERK